MVRSEIVTLRLERDKLALEANFVQEKLNGSMKEFEHQVNIFLSLYFSFSLFPVFSNPCLFVNHIMLLICLILYGILYLYHREVKPIVSLQEMLSSHS